MLCSVEKAKNLVVKHFYRIIFLVILIMNIMNVFFLEQLDPIMFFLFGPGVGFLGFSFYILVFTVIFRCVMSDDTKLLTIIILALICVAIVGLTPQPKAALVGFCISLVITNFYSLLNCDKPHALFTYGKLSELLTYGKQNLIYPVLMLVVAVSSLVKMLSSVSPWL